jgi:hypothetical protein
MITEREYVAVASIFPAKFLPDDERILIRPDHGNDQLKDLQSNWLNALTDFAEGNLHDSTGLKRFPDLEMV